MNARNGRRGARGVVAVVVCVLASVPVEAQEPANRGWSLSLEQALRLAEESSEQVAISRAGVTRSQGEHKRAKSEYFPQVFGSASYTRTLKSEFQDIDFGGVVVDTLGSRRCDTFTPNPSLPLVQRVDSLEAMVGCSSGANPFAGFGELPFGREHQYNLGLSVSQTVFSGGRVQAQNRIARVGRETADTQLQSTRAQLALDVTQAYYDAVLSDRLLTIAEQTLAQADTTLAQVRLAFNVGNQAEFEVLRAKVTFDNQRPVVIQRESDRDLAHIRLKQLLDLPLEAPLTLTSELEDSSFVPVSNVAAALDLPLDTAAVKRAPVRQAADAVRIQEQSLKIAKSQRLPNVSLNTTYGRVAYPVDIISDFGTLRSNWTVSASLQVPIFTGGRISGDEMVARANLDEARARLELTEELAALDTRTTLEQLEAAEATWQASQGTIEQAAKAYRIAEVRYQEGISTQLELSDARLQLRLAEATRALAARDVQVARVRAALLPYLPLSSGAIQAGASVRGTSSPVQMQAPPQVQAGAAGAGFGAVAPPVMQAGQVGTRGGR